LNPYEDLINFVVDSGLSRDEAEHAVRQCVFAMIRKGLAGYTAGGAAAYFMQMNPSTAIPFLLVTTSVGAGYALAKAPQCSEVRGAVQFWNTARF
jgi:hypothetical protein